MPGSCCGRCSPTTGRRGARCGCAAATGSNGGSRVPNRGAPIPPLDREAFRARCGGMGAAAALRRGVRLRPVPRSTAGSRARSASAACSAARSRWATSATGSTRRSRGHGYVPEGVVLLMRYAFESLRLHRLEAAIVPRNAAEPARRREARATRRGNGRCGSCRSRACYEDHIRYAITLEEWQERGAELVERFLTPRVGQADARSARRG